MIDKKTKIVCTIGPATESEAKLTALLKAGMNVMRLNFSHGDFAEHQARIDNLQKAMKKTGLKAAVFQDLGGPKIRIGTFKTESVIMKEGAKFTLTTDKIEGDETRVSVNYPSLPKEVKPGHTIFVHDGKKRLEVIEVKGNDVICKIIVGGEIKGKRGVNLPDSDLSISSMTEKDHADIEFGIKNKVDFVALSFVRRPSDIEELRTILKARKCEAKIIAKIETPQALKCIDEIIEVTDGIMVARGDLAIEIPTENVPIATKDMIEKCNLAGKPVIYATQVMESMIKSPVPTRAEVSDCANGIYDGTDSIMLSEESTLGDYPIHAVEMVAKIAKTVEADDRYLAERNDILATGKDSDVILESAVAIGDALDSKLTVIVTDDFFEAQALASIRPNTRVLVATSSEKTAAQICFSYGCYAMPLAKAKLKSPDKSELMKDIRNFATKNSFAKKGDHMVLVFSDTSNGAVNSISSEVI